ncbi:uncharacterized protein LOC142412069 [Mycteria americana]|uniref:uncharacterized protein LOC142412069 n=1 Tax=Mycteria americana TaxID=33587 RepID=UPI003F58A5C9
MMSTAVKLQAKDTASEARDSPPPAIPAAGLLGFDFSGGTAVALLGDGSGEMQRGCRARIMNLSAARFDRDRFQLRSKSLGFTCDFQALFVCALTRFEVVHFVSSAALRLFSKDISSLLLAYAPLHTFPALRRASVLCSAGFPFLQCASSSNIWEDKRWRGKAVYEIPCHTGVPAQQAAPGGPAAACSWSSVQTCPQDAVGGASQDSAGQGGGTMQTTALSGRGDGSGTTLTAVLPLTSPLFLAFPTPMESSKGPGPTEGNLPGAACALKDGRGERHAHCRCV